MKLRSNRDTATTSNYVPETGRKYNRRASVTANSTTKKSSGKKRRGSGLAGRPSKKKVKIEKLESESMPSTSKKVAKTDESYKTPNSSSCIICRSGRRVANITELPCHIMVKIFELLPIIERVKAERVCRLWNYLGRNFSWSKTDVFSYPALIEQTECTSYRCMNERPCVENTQVRSLMLRCGKYLRCLDLHAFRDSLTYAVCSSFAPYCPLLRSVSLYGIQLTNSALQLLGRHCPNLEDVNFYRCFQESVVERGLTSFFTKCTKLETVDIGGNERLIGVPSFSALPSSITSMKFSGCYRLTVEAMNHLRMNCPQLRTLVMSNVDSLSAAELNNFFVSLEELRKLKFGECFISHTIGGADLNLSPLKNLAELTMNDNLLITDRVLRTIANNCKQLKFIDLSGCNRFVTEEGLLELAKLPLLAYLNLSMLRVTSDNVIKKIAEKGLLKVLLIHRCDEVTDNGIGFALEHCKNLLCLDISFCPKVTDVSMKAMHKFVLEREEREAAEPGRQSTSKQEPDGLVSEMLRLERGLHGLIGADLERSLPRADTLHYQISALQGSQCGGNTNSEESENPEGYTELHVWLGHSGISQPCRSTHRLLKVDDTNSVAEHTPSIFEFRLVIRIN